MPKSGNPYPPEYWQRLVEMVRAGRNPEEREIPRRTAAWFAREAGPIPPQDSSS